MQIEINKLPDSEIEKEREISLSFV